MTSPSSAENTPPSVGQGQTYVPGSTPLGQAFSSGLVGSTAREIGNFLGDGISAINQPPALRTYVYAPEVKVIIAHGPVQYDVSADVVRCQLVRPENSAATFVATLQNKDLRYTPLDKPRFSRMDRITVYMKKTSWTQVFSGYLDSVPYRQLYPGTVNIKATCTIKRLMHTWVNPDLPQTVALLNQLLLPGFETQSDSGLGQLLQRVMIQVGGWSAENLHIQNFPVSFFNFLNSQVVTNRQQSQMSMDTISQLLLGSNATPGPGADAGSNPNAGVPGPWTPGVGGVPGASAGVADTLTMFYVSQIVSACDDRGMGPLVADNNLSASLAQAGETGAASGSPYQNPGQQKAWQQVQQANLDAQQANRNSDAAILCVAAAMSETGAGTGIRNICNPSVPNSDQYANDGPGLLGTTGVGILGLPTSTEWGNLAQRMNPKQAAGMFMYALGQHSGWRNMNPGEACSMTLRNNASGKYEAAVAVATEAVKAYRLAMTGPQSTVVTAASGSGPTVATGSSATALANGSPGANPNLVAGAASATPSPVVSPGTANPLRTDRPQPDSEGAINWAMTQLGKPYVWGGKGPASYDCVLWSDLVATERGEIRICDLTTEDRVLTRDGFKRVLRVWKVRDDAEVMSVRVGDRMLTTTLDHRIWTETRGWIAAKDLGPSDILVSCRMQESPGHVKPVAAGISGGLIGPTAVSNVGVSPAPMHDGEGWEIAPQTVSFSTAWPTTDTQTPRTSPSGSTTSDRSGLFTWRYGSTTTALFQRATRFITSVTTPSTTTSPTWTASRGRSIAAKVRRLVGCTTISARGAVSRFGHLLLRGLLGDSVRSSTSGHSTISSPRRGDVYDVMVEDTHEFFANGVLVHNCSGLVSAAFKSIGIDVPAQTNAIRGAVPKVPNASVQRGDLVEPSEGHVVIWCGDGTIIEAPQSGDVVHRVPSWIGPPSSWAWVGRACLNGGVDPTAPFNPPETMGPGTTPGALDQQAGSTGVGSSGASDGVARNLFSYMFTNQFASNTASLFTGKQAFINGQPLLQLIQAIASAGLRSWSSAPNGDFMAWYPDYWGLDGKPAVLRLEDIELTDVHIDFSDDPLTTHVYVAGDYTMVGQANPIAAWLNSKGTVTVEDEQQWLFQRLIQIAPLDDETFTGDQLMRRYGIRPMKQVFAMAGSQELEFLLATKVFMEKWAQQYQTTIQMTFMPELFPGMRIELAGKNLQVYVASVTHVCDNEQGYHTEASIMAPSTPMAKKLMAAVKTAQGVDDLTAMAFSRGSIPSDTIS